MTKIQYDIKSCEECQFLLKTTYPTSDSWEHAQYWHCDKKRDVLDEPLKIAGYVETFDKIEIPNWCPLRIGEHEKT